MNQTTHSGGLMLDCLSCRELARNMHPTVAATIPATDLCSDCLETSLRGALRELGSLLAEISAGINAGRDVLPDDLIDQADSALKERRHVTAALETVLPDIIRQAKAEALREAADEFWARLPDGTGNGRAYNAWRVANTLRDRADRIEAGR